MIHLGRYFLGEQTVVQAGALATYQGLAPRQPAATTQATLRVLKPDGTTAEQTMQTVWPGSGSIVSFHTVFDGNDQEGGYLGLVSGTFVVGGVEYAVHADGFTWTVVADPAGHGSGATSYGQIIAIAAFEFPEATAVVYETQHGTLVAETNPQ